MVRHYVFGCRRCSTRLWLPVEIVNDAAALVCPNPQCRWVLSYSWKDAEVWDSEKVPVFPLGSLNCPDCGTELPLFAFKQIPSDAKSRQEEFDTWMWNDLKCLNGHRIPKPKL